MYLADPVVKKAIHAPNKDWAMSVEYFFGGREQEDDTSKRSSGLFTLETTR